MAATYNKDENNVGEIANDKAEPFGLNEKDDAVYDQYMIPSFGVGHYSTSKRDDAYEQGVNQLCQVLSENSNFVDLRLADNQITSKMAEQFFEVLSSMPGLLSLDLSENYLDDASAIYIADLLLVYIKFYRYSLVT
ncbi:unnamed protein product [Hydatigera taeniaeformis]|uniref:Leucine-rich repeat-containing protein n=1 Tax=Hydatigena taeniaeformis TaxID=6205 RepID=A0A0R3WIL1_HYDTA|nr:unnamed protein product [Hydatigera taeniaeformis]